jgi:hypothetical protein
MARGQTAKAAYADKIANSGFLGEEHDPAQLVNADMLLACRAARVKKGGTDGSITVNGSRP